MNTNNQHIERNSSNNSLDSINTDDIDDYSGEPLFDKSKRRFSIFPIEYNKLYDMYKTQEKAFWRAEEIDFSQDYQHFKELNENEQHVIKMILAFFANADGIVNFNIANKLLNEITIKEAEITYNFQMMMENIHGITYSLMLENIIKDKNEKNKLFNAITTIPSIKLMSDWAFKWIDSDCHPAKRIVAFACVEGIFFSGAFATIFWLKKYKSIGKKFMPGLIKSNEFIARDEGLHCEFACELYHMIINKPNKDDILDIVKEAVIIAQNFINDSIKVKLIGLNSDLMNQYIEYVADRLIVSLGYNKIFNKINPFSFIDTIGFAQKTNFHDERPTEYVKADNDNDLVILNDDEF